MSTRTLYTVLIFYIPSVTDKAMEIMRSKRNLHTDNAECFCIYLLGKGENCRMQSEQS